jgi:hypothetical protein
MEDRDNAKHEKEETIMTQAALIQDAVKTARLKERQHFAKVIVRHRDKERELSYKVCLYQDRTIAAELNAKTAARQAYQSMQQSKNIFSVTMMYKKDA